MAQSETITVNDVDTTKRSLDGNGNGVDIEKLDDKQGEISADLMDEKRKNRKAYEYLCRLSEVRTWIGELLADEGIPPPIDLEENLTNGVLLARIGNAISAKLVPLSKIFDLDQSKYQHDGLTYRHTDNIVQWRKSLLNLGFPEIIIPETVDIYQGKNVATIFCLFTLAIYLHRLRKGPPLKNQTENIHFSESDVQFISERLKDQKLPSFDDAEGILSNRSVSKADLNSTSTSPDDEAIKALEDKNKTEQTRAAIVIQENFRKYKMKQETQRKFKEEATAAQIKFEEEAKAAQLKFDQEAKAAQLAYEEEKKVAQKMWEEQTKAAKIIQDSFRKYKRKQNSDTLLNSSDPSLYLVRNFVELLRNTEVDYEEDLTIERTRSRISRLITNNRNMDMDLDELDHKISLLIRNRITLQEVIEERSKIDSKMTSQFTTQGSIRRKERGQLNNLQVLLFHLQVEPQHLSNLFEVCNKEGLYEKGLLPLFHFVYEKREEFLFVRLCREIMKRYIYSLNEPKDFSNINNEEGKKVFKFISRFFQSFPSYDVVAISLKEQHRIYYAEEQEIRVNLNPITMFEEKFNRVPNDIYEALADEEIISVLNLSKSFITSQAYAFADSVLHDIKLPKTVRYLMKVVQVELRNKHSELSSVKISAYVCHFLWKCYLEKPMVEGKLFQRETGKQFSPAQKERLVMITKLIGYAALGKSYSSHEPHLFSLNETISELHNKFLSIVNSTLENNTLDQIYEMNQFTTSMSCQKPIINISLEHLKFLHGIIDEHKDKIFDASGARLRKLFDSIDSKFEEEKIGAHLTLSLCPMAPERINNSIDSQELFIQTRKFFVDLLLCGVAGENVPEVLDSEIDEEHEKVYRELINQTEDPFPTLLSKQQKVRENLKILKEFGIVSSENNYQTLVNQITNEIKRQGQYRQGRNKQIDHLQETVKGLEDKRKDNEERLLKYKECLNSCVENMRRSSIKPQITSSSSKASKMLNDREKLLNPKSLKVSGEKLLKKEIIDVDPKDKALVKEFSKMNFEINFTGKMDQFEIILKKSKTDISTYPINFQDLLELEFNDVQTIPISDNTIFNVKNFIAFLNKKFYAKK
uniref:Calponin-homology (CH) domain-containing protein n=1 Tax=Rhabditophanes sp. KR3021 TaxID=114890 RepID=A0AC35TZX0_9BILA